MDLKMYSNCIVCILAIFVIAGIRAQSYDTDNNLKCPENCTCNIVSDSIDCHGKDYKVLPENMSFEVKTLDLSHNLLTSIPKQLSKYQSLTHLLMSHNQVGYLDKPSLNIPSLELLDLSHNNIRSWEAISTTALNLTKSIKHLDLSHNRIRLDSSFVYLASTSLTHLKMQNCSLRIIPPSFFTKLTNLKNFVVSNNEHLKSLKGIQSATVMELDASYCSLEEINLVNFPILVYANLSGNRLSKIWPQHFSNKFLSVLDLSDNMIKHINSDSFINLPQLKKLSLSSNVFTHLDPKTFVRNMQLQSLSISRTYLTQLIKFDISSLQYLDLSYNEIQNFYPDSLTLMPSLRKLILSRNIIGKLPTRIISSSLVSLDLSTCQIIDIPNATFTYLVNLEELNLAGNRLTSFRPNQMPKFLRRIILDNNPWRCECVSKTFQQQFNYLVVPPAKVDAENKLMCHSPEHLSGYSWRQACSNVWFENAQPLGRSDKLWLYILSMIMAMCVIFSAIMCIRRMHRIKLLRERLEREQLRAEAQARLRRIQLQQQQNLEAQQNAPDPRELVRPPSYAEAILMPRLDGSYSSLAGSRPSIAASNPDVSKRVRVANGKQERQRSRVPKTGEAHGSNDGLDEDRERRRRRRRNRHSAADVVEDVTGNASRGNVEFDAQSVSDRDMSTSVLHEDSEERQNEMRQTTENEAGRS